MKKIFTSLLFTYLFANMVFAQKFDRVMENDIVMKITQAHVNGQNNTDIFKQNEAFLVVYKRKDKTYFANVWKKTGTQSYGEATPLAYEEKNGEMISVFSWDYQNTYDSKRGSTVVILKLKDSASTTTFDVRMSTEDNIDVYKGIVE